jgi:hypothetical protein
MNMLIPAELIPFYPGDIGPGAPAQNNGPRPVSASSAFRSALPDAQAKDERALDRPTPSAREKSDHPGFVPNRRQQASRTGADEPRRKEVLPVLLDTRRLPSRRKSDLRSVINIEI